jgi:hypothetical protein
MGSSSAAWRFAAASQADPLASIQRFEDAYINQSYDDDPPPAAVSAEALTILRHLLGKQRICIARALAAEPDLIICDEVTSALDQLVAEEILKLLQNLQNELKVSYLFITHDLATVKAISDEIVVMLQGRIVEQGAKKEILTPPITNTPIFCFRQCRRWIPTGWTICLRTARLRGSRPRSWTHNR